MADKTLLQRYAEILLAKEPVDIGKRDPKSTQGSGGWGQKEWTVLDIAEYKRQQDLLESEYRGVIRLNWNNSPDHQANIILLNHHRGKIPDECWEYMMEKCKALRIRIDDEREMFSRVDINDWWVRWDLVKKEAAYWRNRSKKQSRVKVNDKGEVQ